MRDAIAIIPARKGSKRIKNKNIKLFHGKPIIYWSIRVAIESGCFDQVIVSTDSLKIKRLSENFGAEVPYLRPKYISNDFASTSDVITHALKKIFNSKKKPKYVCCIYPCAPMIQVKDLKKAFRLLKKGSSDMVFPVANIPYEVQRALLIKKNNNTNFLIPQNADRRTQDLKKTYYDAGQYYFGTTKRWLKSNNIIKDSKAIIIDRSKAIDINNLDDWSIAEKNFRKKLK